jgi:hypothetical protein
MCETRAFREPAATKLAGVMTILLACQAAAVTLAMSPSEVLVLGKFAWLGVRDDVRNWLVREAA